MKRGQKNNAQRRQALNVRGFTKAIQYKYIIALVKPLCQYRRLKNESETPDFFGERMRTGGLHRAGSYKEHKKGRAAPAL